MSSTEDSSANRNGFKSSRLWAVIATLVGLGAGGAQSVPTEDALAYGYDVVEPITALDPEFAALGAYAVITLVICRTVQHCWYRYVEYLEKRQAAS